MDAHAHLISLGWAGPGHSLDSRPHTQHKGRRGLAYDPSQNNNTGRGLVKPLLISQKKNTFGIGKKTHEPAAGNEWWLKGFESALSNIGKNSDSEATSGTATPDAGDVPAYRGKHAGLYGFFVKGKQMEGTIREQRLEESRGQKRKSDTFEDEEDRSTGSGLVTPADSRSRKKRKAAEKAAVEFEQISQFMEIRDKDRKRAERREKVDPAQEFDQVGRFLEARSETKKNKKEKKYINKEDQGDKGDVHVDTDKVIAKVSKEERRLARKKPKIEEASGADELSEKEKRRKSKETKIPAGTISSKAENTRSGQPAGPQADNLEPDSSATAEKAVRKAERKKKKEERRLAKQHAA